MPVEQTLTGTMIVVENSDRIIQGDFKYEGAALAAHGSDTTF